MKRLILTFLALLLLIEEWLWSELTALGNRLSVWLHLLKFDNWLIMASPEIAMAAFILPVLLLAPVQIAALWLAANGQIAAGIALLTLAKLFATLLISHMFMLTRDKLLVSIHGVKRPRDTQAVVPAECGRDDRWAVGS